MAASFLAIDPTLATRYLEYKAKNELFIFSGLGADERAFQHLDFSGHPVTFIHWIPPKEQEAIQEYARRISEQITSPKPILVGLSFGGMMAIEVAKQIDTEKIVLIASAKVRKEIPFYFRWMGVLGLHNFIPSSVMKDSTGLANWFFGAKSPSDKALLKAVLHNTDEVFLKWAIDQIVRWKNSDLVDNTIHIHGTDDRILPFYFVKSDISVEGGGHLMTINRADEITALLKQLLSQWNKNTRYEHSNTITAMSEHFTKRSSSTFDRLAHATDRLIRLEDKDFLFFGGTAYLGLNAHPEYLQYYIEGLSRYGVNNGTSRGNNVQLDIYPKAEQFAAEKYDHEDALLLSSGFLAAQLAIRHLGQNAEIHYAPESHPATWIGTKPTTEGAFETWKSQTIADINRSTASDFVIVSNTVETLVPELHDFNGFDAIDTSKEIHFLLDDSHGIGVLDDTVHQVVKTLRQCKNFKVTVIASMAKALGVDAGLILTDEETGRRLRQTGTFMGASPPSPAALYAYLAAQELCAAQQRKLERNINQFAGNLKQEAVYVPAFPVFYFPDQDIQRRLLDHQIVISSFPYPRPTDPIFNRVVISAAHTAEDIQKISLAIS